MNRRQLSQICKRVLIITLFLSSALAHVAHAQTTPFLDPGHWYVHADDPGEIETAPDPYTACKYSAEQWGTGKVLAFVTLNPSASPPGYTAVCYFPSIPGNDPRPLAGSHHICPSGYEDLGDYCLKWTEAESNDLNPGGNLCTAQVDSNPASSQPQNASGPAQNAGNPILFASGGKVATFADYIFPGDSSLDLFRTYRSQSLQVNNSAHGAGWTNNFSYQLIFSSETVGQRPDKVWFQTPDGLNHLFTWNVGISAYESNGYLDATLDEVAGSNWSEWVLTAGAGRVYEFERGSGSWSPKYGRIELIELDDGYHQRFYYNGGTNPVFITDSRGKYLNLTWAGEVVDEVATSDGVRVDYEYDAVITSTGPVGGSERLTSVTIYPADGSASKTETYHYEHGTHRRLLTGVTDANGVRSRTYAYDVSGRATGSEYAGGANAINVAYDDANNKRTITNALGKDTIYHLQQIDGSFKAVQVEGAASANCLPTNSTFSYDANGNLSQTTDAEGNVTDIAFNSRNLETLRTDASGAPESRSITTTWHADRALPTQIVRPNLTTDYTFGASYELLTRTETDTTSHSVPYSTNGQSRIWTFGYQASATTAPAPINLAVVNPDAETGDTTGWTGSGGGFFADGSTPRIGAYNFHGGNGAHPRMEQDVPIPQANHADIDAGYGIVRLQYSQYSKSNGRDFGWMDLTFLDAAGDPLGNTHAQEKIAIKGWRTKSFFIIAPAGARSVRIAMNCDRVFSSGTCRVYMDEVFLELVINAPRASRLLTSIDGPLPGASDTVSYAYDAQGRLDSVTNEVGHVTDIVSVNASGQPTAIDDPNGVRTTLAYDGEGRIKTVTVNPGANQAITTIAYDPVGLITRVTPPDGAYLDYEYDDARRLSAIENAAGERIEYAYNALGNVMSTTVKSGTGAIVQSQTRTYDELGRLMKLIGADLSETTFTYDLNDNVATVTDPRSELFSYAYDGLNRLLKETDPDLGETDFGLDASDDTVSVDDAKNLTTSYVRNGFGDAIRRTSPDTGVTDYIYDERDLVTQMTDARSVVSTYAYDDAGRILSESYPANTTQNVTYVYDATAGGNYGVGRLTSTTDGAGSTSFVYDARGNILSETRVTGTQSYTVAYEYDTGDKATKITYPSGRIVDLSYDAAGRISGVDMREDAISTPASVLSNITYFPMSGAGSIWSLKSATYGNALALAIGHDADGRLKDIDLAPAVGPAVEDLTYGYDLAGNITSITDNLDASRTETYQYDSLSRLTQGTGAYGTIDYTYDLVGNRLTRVWDIGGTAYGEALAYGAGSHQLSTVTGGGGTSVRTMTYAASGQLATDEKDGTTFVYDYDDAGRMVEALNGTTSLASYAYDAFEQRVEKDDGSSAVHYVYDLAGRLIAEHDGATGAALREYVYLGLMPALYVDHSGANPVTYYVHTDQVMRPRKLTDAAGAVLWDRIATPFGDEHTVTGTLTQKLQFPGQIEETETEFFQNWHRDYDPELGRYVQSDPIGLLGGINTYAYVEGNPVSAIDPDGLTAIALPGGAGTGEILAGGSRVGPYGAALAGSYVVGAVGGTILANTILDELNNAQDLIGFDAYTYCPISRKDPCEGLRKQLKEHQDKLAEYLKNPLRFDNKGILGDAINGYNFLRSYGIQYGRIRNLNKQIQNFKRLLKECEKQNGLR